MWRNMDPASKAADQDARLDRQDTARLLRERFEPPVRRRARPELVDGARVRVTPDAWAVADPGGERVMLRGCEGVLVEAYPLLGAGLAVVTVDVAGMPRNACVPFAELEVVP